MKNWKNYKKWYLDQSDEFLKIFKFSPDEIICFDLETTGLDKANDEILQLSIIDGNSDVLFDSLIKPAHKKSWAGAEAINGISPAMVKTAPTFEDIKPKIQS